METAALLLFISLGYLLLAIIISVSYCYIRLTTRQKNLGKLVKVNSMLPDSTTMNGASITVTNQKAMGNTTNMSNWTGMTNATWLRTDQEIAIPGYLRYLYLVDFRPGKLIASGGSGNVHYCDTSNAEILDRCGGQKLVVKVIQSGSDPREQEVFYQELSLMWFLRQCPQLAQVYAFSDAPPCIVMAFYENGSLFDLLRRKSPAVQKYKLTNPSMRNWLTLLFDVAKGIGYMHKLGLVHNDIKCQNILIAESNNQIHAVVTDLGLTRVMNPNEMLVKSFKLSQIKGASFPFAAPEVLERVRNVYDEQQVGSQVWMAADIYAFAIVMLECTTRKPAWGKGGAKK